MGDVAMLIPTVYAVAKANPKDSFTFLTQPFFAKLLLDKPDNLLVKTIDIKGTQSNVGGLLAYALKLRGEHYDQVIDLHNVLRTRIIRSVLNLGSKSKCFHLTKPRQARKAFLKASSSNRQPVPRMLDLYAQTLRQAGLKVPTDIKPINLEAKEVSGDIFFNPPAPEEGLSPKRIGIAPFASTDSKTYDLEQMRTLLNILAQEEHYYLYLLGAKGSEANQLKEWAKDYKNVLCLAGDIALEEELSLIAGLDCVLSMDSSNAHLAGMLGTKVVSIWITTHPDAGFMSFGLKREDCLVPNPKLYPPCSIFGKIRDKSIDVEAYRKAIQPEQIAKHIKQILA